MPEPATKPKTKIATLFRQLRYFKWSDDYAQTGVFLVNQKALEEDGQLEPSRDDLLRRIGEASTEMIDFMKSNDRAQDTIGSMTVLIDRFGQLLSHALGAEKPIEDPVDALETILVRYRRMQDFLRHIQHNIPADKIKDKVEEFLQFKQLATNEEATQSNAGCGQSVCSCEKQLVTVNPRCPFHGARAQLAIEVATSADPLAVSGESVEPGESKGANNLVPFTPVPDSGKEKP